MSIKNKKSNQRNLQEQLELGDYIDLTITQILILYLLRIYPNGTIRFTIFQEVNKRLSEDNKISPSSFYHSIKKLEKKELISCQREKNDQISTVKIELKADIVLDQVAQILVMGSLDFRKKVIPKILPFYKEKIGVSKNFRYDSLLIISLEMAYDRIFTIANIFAKNIHAIVDDKVYDIYYKGGTDFIRTEILYGMIREPNETFDIAIISPYYKATSYFDLSHNKLFQEVMRVIKPGGKLIIITGDELPKTDHILVEIFLETISKGFLTYSISEQKLKEDFESAGIINYEIWPYKGMLIATVKKK